MFREAVASPVIILTILSIILGTGLGLRLTSPLLFPLVTTGMAIVTLIGFAQGQGAWWFVVATIVAATGLQFGYLAAELALVVFPPERQLRVAELRVPFNRQEMIVACHPQGDHQREPDAVREAAAVLVLAR